MTTKEEAIKGFETVLKYLTKEDFKNREEMQKTPARYIKMMEELITKEPFEYTSFELPEGCEDMIIQGPIYTQSLCSHHTAIFRGETYVAYLPNKKMVGLSKLARCVQNAGKGFMSQEELVADIVNALEENIEPRGVAVYTKMKHDCVSARGAKSRDSSTIVSRFSGEFKDNKELRKEFLQYIKK